MMKRVNQRSRVEDKVGETEKHCKYFVVSEMLFSEKNKFRN